MTGSEGTEDVTKILDMESNAILMELQDALDAVALDEESIRSIRTKRGSGGDLDNDDPASQEHELSMLMDVLVSELRADLETQMTTDDFLMRKQNSPSDVVGGLNNLGPLVPPPTPREVANDELNAVSTHSAQSTASFDVPEVLADFTQEAIEGLSPAQKDLLQRLRHHLHQKHNNNENPDEDRVFQEIPDFATSSTQDDVRFEKLQSAATGDEDFVPIADYSKPKSSKRELKPLKTQLPTEEEALELAEAMALAVRYHPTKSQDEIRNLVFSQKEFRHLDPTNAIKDHSMRGGTKTKQQPPSTRRVPGGAANGRRRGMPQRAPSFTDRIQNFFKNRNNNKNNNQNNNEDKEEKKLPEEPSSNDNNQNSNKNPAARQQQQSNETVFDKMERGNVWKRISELVFKKNDDRHDDDDELGSSLEQSALDPIG